MYLRAFYCLLIAGVLGTLLGLQALDYVRRGYYGGADYPGDSDVWFNRGTG